MIEHFAQSVLAEIVRDASNSFSLCLIVDGTTYISGQEQFTICIQYTNEKLKPANSFIGYYNAPVSSGSTLANVIRDVLIRNNLPLYKVIGYSFDTASNISGRYQGV